MAITCFWFFSKVRFWRPKQNVTRYQLIQMKFSATLNLETKTSKLCNFLYKPKYLIQCQMNSAYSLVLWGCIRYLNNKCWIQWNQRTVFQKNNACIKEYHRNALFSTTFIWFSVPTMCVSIWNHWVQCKLTASLHGQIYNLLQNASRKQALYMKMSSKKSLIQQIISLSSQLKTLSSAIPPQKKKSLNYLPRTVSENKAKTNIVFIAFAFQTKSEKIGTLLFTGLISQTSRAKFHLPVNITLQKHLNVPLVRKFTLWNQFKLIDLK